MEENEIPQKVDDRPHLKYLVRHVRDQLCAACESNPQAWKDLGRELMPDSDAALSTIAVNAHGNVINCCSSLFNLWLQRQPDASWRQLIQALKDTRLNTLATQIEKKLQSSITLDWTTATTVSQIPKATYQASAGGSEVSRETKKGKGYDSEIIASNVHSNSKDTLDLAVHNQTNINVSGVSAPVHWTKGEMLGAGAIGKVYLCDDLDTGRQLALKVVQIDSNTPQKEVQSLEKEIEILTKLKHERIVVYFGTSRTDTNIYIFMEYMPGGSVRSHLHKVGELNETLTRKYTKQILEGTNYLHSHNIVHRDIKGANVLRDSSGNVKIADFGASKKLHTIHQSSKTGVNSLVGTTYWMAPEAIDQVKFGSVGPKADIWSIGCTVVEMLTCNPPLYDLEPVAAIYRIMTEPPAYDLPLHCSEHVHNFLKLCLIKDIKTRPSAPDLLEHSFVN